MDQLKEREEIRNKINQRLVQSGEREKLKDLLRQRLEECGWREELKKHCKTLIKEKGISNVTIDEIVQEVTPVARTLIPEMVKRELLERIKTFMDQEIPEIH